jgi:hypothetical protein
MIMITLRSLTSQRTEQLLRRRHFTCSQRWPQPAPRPDTRVGRAVSLPTVEPTEAINLVEVVLRDLVRLVLGDSWTQSRKIEIDKLKEKRREDIAKRRGTAVNEDLLAYTEFTQLQQIILDNWSKFAVALGKQKYIAAYFDRLNAFRNPAMHSRPLREFERDLVNGIVGELRNLVVLYRSSQGPDMEYYPKIEQVTDSFGNNPGTGLESGRLKVGDQVKFQCRGWDPQDRNLTWELRIGRTGIDFKVTTEAHGAEATLTLDITKRMVQERLHIEISMMSDSQYHRHGFYDELCDFYYAVDPPAE